MTETWHERFNPKQFLSKVNIDHLIEHNKVHNESQVDWLEMPCIVCGGNQAPGVLLNDKSYLCKQCFIEVSTIRYPEKYERLQREYLRSLEARGQARTAFIQNCSYRKISIFIVIAGWISLLLLFVNVAFVFVPVACYCIYRVFHTKHEEKLTQWDSAYPNPVEPQLRHFHDPLAELSYRDRAILKVFNNWPGYPPFWGYLREVVLERDGNKCQVSGCPSRVELHIHHKIPISLGGQHVPTNLVTLCDFHHALEPEEGHERVWGEIKTRYFTMVRAHRRRNPSSMGYHDVRAHVRRLELISESELFKIIDIYGLSCPSCSSGDLKSKVDKQNQQVHVVCSECSEKWIGRRELAEETGPRLAEVLNLTKNKGCWEPRWDMLEVRSDSTFRLLRKDNLKLKKNRKTIRTRNYVIPKCPKCGSPMRLVKPRRGNKWKAFWGCTKYRTTGCTGAEDDTGLTPI